MANVSIYVLNEGSINPELAKILMWWYKLYDIAMPKTPQLKPIDAARNWCVQDFLKGNGDFLFFIDDDVVPDPRTLVEFVKHDKDVVGTLCFIMKPHNGLNVPIITALDNENKLKYGAGLQEVSYIGTGCMMIRREVLERTRFYFTYNNDGTLNNSEDYNFCRDARELGYKVWCDYGLVSDHIKEVSLKNINDLLVRENGR